MDPIQPDESPSAPDQPTEPQTPEDTTGSDTTPSPAANISGRVISSTWNTGSPAESSAPAAASGVGPLSTESTTASVEGSGQPEHMVADGMNGLSSYNVISAPNQTGRKSRKKWWLAGGGLIIVLLLAAGWVFGFYIPNKPENVWKTGLNRTGDALQSLVNSGTDEKAVDKFKSIALSGDVTISAKDVDVDASFNGQLDDSYAKAGFALTAKQTGEKEYKLSSDMIAKILPHEDYPDLYFKMSGFKDLGLDALLPGIGDYDGKWIFASNTTLHKYLGDISAKDTSRNEVTAKDVTELTQNVTKTMKDYVFNGDPTKTILVNKQFVGKEKQEGVDTYHYKVAFDKDNVKAFCSALGNGVATTEFYKKTVDEKDRTKQKDSFIKSCQEDDGTTSNDTIDMWIDSHYKLIHKVRLYDNEDKSMYVDIGQTYKGGDEFSLFAVAHDPKEKIEVSWNQTSNMKTNESTGKLHVTSGDVSNKFTVDVNYKAKVSDQKVKQDIPADATPLPDVLKKLGFPEPSGPLVPSSVRSI